MAEGGGFEPPEAFTSTVFKTVAFVRSATLPSETIATRQGSTVLSAHFRRIASYLALAMALSRFVLALTVAGRVSVPSMPG